MMTTAREKRRRSAPSRAKVSVAVGRVLETAASRLSDAANGNLSTEPLHELRVACRRAEAALRLCRERADSRAWRWLKRRLRTFRHACNEVRDDDVLRKWLKRLDASSSKPLRQALRDHREELEPQIVRLARRLTKNHRFEQRSRRVLDNLRAAERRRGLAQFFGQTLFEEVAGFVKSLPAHRNDAAALHRMRIVGKRLRYASELVTEIWPDVDLAELKEHLHSLQDQLGAIHDQVVGERRLRKRSLRHTARAARPLARKAQDTAKQLQRRFWRWWQACPIERMLADTTAEVLTLMSKQP